MLDRWTRNVIENLVCPSPAEETPAEEERNPAVEDNPAAEVGSAAQEEERKAEAPQLGTHEGGPTTGIWRGRPGRSAADARGPVFDDAAAAESGELLLTYSHVSATKPSDRTLIAHLGDRTQLVPFGTVKNAFLAQLHESQQHCVQYILDLPDHAVGGKLFQIYNHFIISIYLFPGDG